MPLFQNSLFLSFSLAPSGSKDFLGLLLTDQAFSQRSLRSSPQDTCLSAQSWWLCLQYKALFTSRVFTTILCDKDLWVDLGKRACTNLSLWPAVNQARCFPPSSVGHKNKTKQKKKGVFVKWVEGQALGGHKIDDVGGWAMCIYSLYISLNQLGPILGIIFPLPALMDCRCTSLTSWQVVKGSFIYLDTGAPHLQALSFSTSAQ